jgi:hypothetical protein
VGDNVRAEECLRKGGFVPFQMMPLMTARRSFESGLGTPTLKSLSLRGGSRNENVRRGGLHGHIGRDKRR